MSVGVAAASGLTPLTLNFAGLKRQVVNFDQGTNDPDLLNVAGESINSCIDTINGRTWNWSLKTETLTPIATQDWIQAAANFKKPRKMLSIL